MILLYDEKVSPSCQRMFYFSKFFFRKFVFDAIPMVGTGASVKLMKTLISNDDVTGADADMWLASLAFIHHPTGDMIKEVRVTVVKSEKNWNI